MRRAVRWLSGRAGQLAARLYVVVAGAPVDPAYPWGRFLTRPRVELPDRTNDLELQGDLVFITRRGVVRRRARGARWDGASWMAWLLSLLGPKTDWRRRFASCLHDERCVRRDEPAWLSHLEYFEVLMADGNNPRRALLEGVVVFLRRPWWRVQGGAA